MNFNVAGGQYSPQPYGAPHQFGQHYSPHHVQGPQFPGAFGNVSPGQAISPGLQRQKPSGQMSDQQLMALAQKQGINIQVHNGQIIIPPSPKPQVTPKPQQHHVQIINNNNGAYGRDDPKRQRPKPSSGSPQSTAEIQSPLSQYIRSKDYEPVFRYDYSYRDQTWSQTVMMVKIETTAFAEGGLRSAFKAIDFSKPYGTHGSQFVAKKYKTQESMQLYFIDVEMQSICEYYANKYNKKGAPKLIKFIHAFIIECFTKSGKPLYCCEELLSGKYEKFNNNAGFVSADDRNTPQAFSHYTHSASKGELMIVDIQGVVSGEGYVYTDPQIHSKSARGFGKGNLGPEGFRRFFQTHKCNAICVGLGICPKERQQDYTGTEMNPVKLKAAIAAAKEAQEKEEDIKGY